MLASAETVSVVAETLKAHAVPVIVLDPVRSPFTTLSLPGFFRKSMLNV